LKGVGFDSVLHLFCTSQGRIQKL